MTTGSSEVWSVAELNAAHSLRSLSAQLTALSGSEAWTESIIANRPYRSAADALAAGDDATERLSEDSLIEALRAHPRIGGPTAAGSASESEQARAASGPADVLAAIDALADRYENTMELPYLVAAAGKSAEEIHADITSRVAALEDAGWSPAARTEELRIARYHLSRITRNRFAALLGVDPSLEGVSE